MSGKEGETVERGRQWEGGDWKGETVGRREEGKKEVLLRLRKGKQLKGGDSGKEERGKEKRAIKGKGRGDG